MDDEDKKLALRLQEENGLKNQLVLFVDRIINLHTPIYLGRGLSHIMNGLTYNTILAH